MAKVAKTTATETGIKALESTTGILTIPGVSTQMLTTLIIGTAVLVSHKFSAKATSMMLAKQVGKASAGRQHKDPVAYFEGSRHRLTDGSDGIPAGGIKAAIADACDVKSGLAKAKAKGAIRVLADDPLTNLVRILGPAPEDMGPPNHDYEYDGPAWPRLRQDMVRLETGVADVRHRPEYPIWAMLLRVEYLPSVASAEQVLQAIAMSGFSVGLGEWRPKSKSSLSGSLGTFRLATADEVAAYENGTLFKTLTAPIAKAA